MSWRGWGDGPVRPASPSVFDEVLRVSRGARRPGRPIGSMHVSPDVAARLLLVSEQLSGADAPALPLWGVPVVLDPKLPPGTVQWTYLDGETVRPHLAHHDAQEAPAMPAQQTTTTTRRPGRWAVLLAVLVALALAAVVVLVGGLRADAAGGGTGTGLDVNSTRAVEVVGVDSAGQPKSKVLTPGSYNTGYALGLARVDSFLTTSGSKTIRFCRPPGGSVFSQTIFYGKGSYPACPGNDKMVLRSTVL